MIHLIHFSCPLQIHGTTNIKGTSCVVSFIRPEAVNESNEMTNTYIGQQIVRKSSQHPTTTKNISSEMTNILSHNTSNHSKEIIPAPSLLLNEILLREKNLFP